MMNIKKYDIKKILSLSLLFIILICFGGINLAVESFGQSLFLETIPYDPVDLFRGDYVDLQYEIETIDISLVDKSMYKKKDPNNYDYIEVIDSDGYLIYDEGSRPLKAIALVADKPKGTNYIKAQLYSIDEYRKIALLNISLNRYYVPEGTGGTLEQLSREGKLVVEIKKLGPLYTLKAISKIE